MSSLLRTAIYTASTMPQAEHTLFIKSRCEASGMDPDSYRCVIGVLVRLGGEPVVDKGPGWRNDHEYLGALVDLECDLHTKLRQINNLIDAYTVTLAAINEYTRVADIAALHASLDILQPAKSRVAGALKRMYFASEDLTETYAVCYRHIRAGKKLPHRGRFISGDVAL